MAASRGLSVPHGQAKRASMNPHFSRSTRILRARELRPPAQPDAAGGGIARVFQSPHHPPRHDTRLARIDVAEHHQVREQNRLVAAEALAEVRPVERAAARQDQVQHVGAVEAFAFHHERLAPQQLFGRTQQHVESEHACRHRALEVQVVHARNRVAAVEDDVHERVALDRLAEPVRKRQPRVDARRPQRARRFRPILSANHQIEILGLAIDERVARHGVGAADEKRQIGMAERP